MRTVEKRNTNFLLSIPSFSSLFPKFQEKNRGPCEPCLLRDGSKPQNVSNGNGGPCYGWQSASSDAVIVVVLVVFMVAIMVIMVLVVLLVVAKDKLKHFVDNC